MKMEFLESCCISEIYLLENRTGFVNILLSKVYSKSLRVALILVKVNM